MMIAGILLFVVSLIVLLLAGVTADGTDSVHKRDMCGQWMATAFVGMILALLMVVAAVAKYVKG